jgi:hypothetical protein
MYLGASGEFFAVRRDFPELLDRLRDYEQGGIDFFAGGVAAEAESQTAARFTGGQTDGG